MVAGQAAEMEAVGLDGYGLIEIIGGCCERTYGHGSQWILRMIGPLLCGLPDLRPWACCCADGHGPACHQHQLEWPHSFPER